jgi:hypothetical protein
MNLMNKTRVGKEEEEEVEEGEMWEIDLTFVTQQVSRSHIHPKVVRREWVWYSPSGPI